MNHPERWTWFEGERQYGIRQDGRLLSLESDAMDNPLWELIWANEETCMVLGREMLRLVAFFCTPSRADGVAHGAPLDEEEEEHPTLRPQAVRGGRAGTDDRDLDRLVNTAAQMFWKDGEAGLAESVEDAAHLIDACRQWLTDDDDDEEIHLTVSEPCGCGCSHAVDYGACGTYCKGMNGRCVYCDHGLSCHPGKGPFSNGPLSPLYVGDYVEENH